MTHGWTYLQENYQDVLADRPVTDHYSLAVISWHEASEKRRMFALQVSLLDKDRYQELADQLLISKETVITYANAYKLYYEMQRQFENREIDELWNELYPQIWVGAAKHQSKYNLSFRKILGYLRNVRDNNLSVDAFRELIDEKENPLPKWIRRIIQVAKVADAFLRGDYMSEMSPEEQEEVRNIIDDFTNRMTKLAEKRSK